MNKKTLSRIAAFSLACAAVVPSFGVVASADVAVNVALGTISGTANHVKWQIDSVTKTIKADYNATNNTLSFNETYMYVADYAVNAFAPDYAGTNDIYYASAQQASSTLAGLNAAVKAENANGTDGSVEYSEWKKSWTNYQSDTSKFNSALATYKQRKAVEDAGGAAAVAVTYVDSTGTPQTVSSTSASNPHSAPTSDEDTLIIYSVTSSNEVKNMTQLEDELGPKVDIADGEIKAGATYAISTTGSSTGTTTGSTTTSATYSMPASSYRTSSSYVYYSNLTHMYYPNLSALQSVEGVHSNYVKSVPSISYSSTNCYFDALNGTYRSYLYDSYSYKVNNTENSIYKVKGYYYATYSDAYSAANGDTSKIDFVRTYSTSYDYFSNVTGSFYSTYYAALSASNGDSSKVDVFNGASTYDYYDPYYYYYLNYGNTSTTTKDTTSATMGKKSGWTAIAKSLKSTSAGSTVTVTMNDEETIPSTVLSAIKGRNVTVKFTLDNGVVYTVNGKDVTTAKDVDINTTYNTKNVPSKLAKAAVKKNDGVSSAQISIDSSSLGFTSDVTIKLPSKRAGYSAKLYRYNSSRNSLVLVDTATIKTNGKCTFENVTKGGDYVVVVY